MSLGTVRMRATAVGLTCCTWLAAGAGSALAEETRTFTYTGGEQEFKVPGGVTSLHVVAVGGEGGSGEHTGPGGLGAVVSANIAVESQQVLYVEVGGVENISTEEGHFIGPFNGGGPGDPGGGASDVRTVSIGAEPSPGGTASLESRLLVAGGGGGGGFDSSSDATIPLCAGSAGGNAGEKGGNGASCGYPGGEGGGAGEATKGGAGGTGYCASDPDGTHGEAGSLGQGGSGAGGGGGGLYGGGGGGFQNCAESLANGETFIGGDGAGGGGSNLVPAGGEAKLAKAKQATSVTIAYTPPCTRVVGEGTYLKTGEPGHLIVRNNLDTNLAEPQKLRVVENSGEEKFRLTKLEQASCELGEDSALFRGEGQAAKGTEHGYHVVFTLSEVLGRFSLESHVSKNGNEVELDGGPLKTKTERIF